MGSLVRLLRSKKINLIEPRAGRGFSTQPSTAYLLLGPYVANPPSLGGYTYYYYQAREFGSTVRKSAMKEVFDVLMDW